MALRQRIGFTLVELLVVITIMGVLAGLLFPVLGRARQAARRTQCLANVKGITAAITMYVADWDGFWPTETRSEVIDYFNAAPGGGQPRNRPEVCQRSYQGNPYLRPALILDGYIRDREVWRCPDASILNGASMIIAPPSDGDWLQVWKDHEGRWGQKAALGPCYTTWPSGWGGPVTDSFASGSLAILGERESSVQAGVFLQSIGVNDHLRWQKLSGVDDPTRHVICGDAGTRVELWGAAQLAYPDTCGLGYSGGPDGRQACVGADWDNCTWTRECGLTPGRLKRFYEEPSYRERWARHGGGSNVGFLDGHAKWYPADQLLMESTPFNPSYFEGELCACWPGNGKLRGNGLPYQQSAP